VLLYFEKAQFLPVSEGLWALQSTVIAAYNLPKILKRFSRREVKNRPSNASHKIASFLMDCYENLLSLANRRNVNCKEGNEAQKNFN